MVYRDRTAMGGDRAAFTTTCWTEIYAVRTQGEAQRRLLMDHLIGRYWKPVYCYLRRKGMGNEAAKDLTQGFFYEVVLGRDLIARADSARGRFRTFLLTALDRYLIDVHRKQQTQIRQPEGNLIALESESLPDLPDDQQEGSPDQAFCYAWASALLDEVLAEVETDCRHHQQAVHWQVFKARVLGPIMEDVQAPSLAQLCEQFDIESEAKASNMIVTVKRKFRKRLENHLRQQVADDEDVNNELAALLTILSRPGAG